MPKTHLLAIDQGTTSTRAILFDAEARPVRSHAVPLRQIYPANGWVEHDPGEIWRAVLECCRTVLAGVEWTRWRPWASPISARPP
jgi:glycerol kinase